MKRVLLASILLLVPAIGIPLLNRSHGDIRGGIAPPTAPVRTVSAPREPTTIQGLGYVEPRSEVSKLAFKINGIITRCPAEVGRHYSRGDVLAELDSREQLAALEVAEAEWRLAQAQRDKTLSGVNPHQIESAVHKVEMLKEHADYSEKEHDRAKPLIARGAVSPSEYGKTFRDWMYSSAELRQAQADLRNLRHSVRVEDRTVAEAMVVAARAKLALAKQQFEDTILRAPIDGTVLELLRREGESSRLSDTEPVLLFGDLTRLRVRAEVDERFVTLLRLGQRATISGKGLRGYQYEGRVVLIKPIMGNKTVFSRASTERKDLDIIQVLIELGPEFSLPIGLEVDVKLVPN